MSYQRDFRGPAGAGSTLAKPDSTVARVFSEKSAQLNADLARRKARKQLEEKDQSKREIDIDEHLMTVQETEKFWGTDVKAGLTDEQVAQKLEEWGPNELTPPPSKPMWLLFLEQMTGFFSLLLWLAGILCFIAYGLDGSQEENLYLGIVLVVVVFMTGCFSYYQEAKSVAVMEGFKNFLPEYTIVIRGGRERKILASEIVPGDVVVVKSGEKIPADFRVVQFSNFKVNNSSLTGESIEVKRVEENIEENPLEATNLAFYGTLCVDGSARGIVIRTADRTVIGTIAKLATSTENTETPIALEIHHFIKIVSGVAIFLGVTFMIINFAKGVDAIENVVFCIGIIVANVPEGLLATVTVSLTLTAKRMAKKKVLVKNLESVETLGSTTVIASDKTGTLTCNRMTVAHVWYNRKVYLAEHDIAGAYDKEDPTFDRLRTIATLCNNAVFINLEQGRPILQRETKGDASESALIKFCEAVQPIREFREQHPRIIEVPFNSANKYQVSINRMNDDWDKPRLITLKGAPERVWNRCSHVLVDGQLVPKEDVEEDYLAAQAQLMGGGERVLGFCMRELDPQQFPKEFVYDNEEYNFPIEEGMIFVGLMSLMDPPRTRVPPAVLNCQQAGIRVIMVTGDHPDTAEAIAKKVHIIKHDTRKDVAAKRGVPVDEVKEDDPDIVARVVTGAQLLDMDDKMLDDVLDFDELVFARTSPQQKLIIVRGLQNKQFYRRGHDVPQPIRHVVAVTGDGVNDSPALKAANIGVAMGITGSDVAKDAADMILLNDNFASIVDGVEEGRLIFDNLKKSIAYTLSSNIPEISPFLINILIAIPLPLPTVLILCIDLGTDMVPAISLAYENKESNIMKKPPRDMHTERLVTTKLISFSYLQVGMIQALAGFYTYFVVLNDYGFHPSDLPNKSDLFDEDNSSDVTFSNGDPRADGTPLNSYGEAFYDGTSVKFHPCNIERRGICHVPHKALQHAQTAFFISIIIVQWADILACKTRTLSLKHQGMRNGMLNFGLFFETTLGAGLCYIPGLNDGLGTAPLSFVHWLPALPFSILILSYDEIRKYFMRNLGKGNWLERNTYY